MGKKLANDNDPLGILAQKQNGQDPKDPLGILKKKDTTPVGPATTGSASVTPSSQPVKPSVKSTEEATTGPKRQIGLFETWKQIKNQVVEAIREGDTPESIAERDARPSPLLNAMKRGWKSGEVAEIISPFKHEVKPEDLKKVSQFQSELQKLPASEAYLKFNESKTFGEALTNLAKNPAEIITEITLESMAGIVNYGSTRIPAGAATGAAMGSVVPGIGTASGAGAGVIVGLADTSLALEYSSAFLESLQKSGVDVTNPEQLQKAFENENLLSEARTHAYKKGVPIAIFDLISGGVAGKIVTKPAKSLVGKAGKYVAEFGIQSGLGGAGELAGQVSAGEEINPSSIIAEMVGELGTTPLEISSNLMGRKPKVETKPQDVREVIKEQTKKVTTENIESAEQAADKIQQSVVSDETIKKGPEEPPAGGAGTAVVPEATQEEALQAPEGKSEVEEKLTKFYRGGPESSMPRGLTAEDVINFEKDELGNADIIVEPGVNPKEIKSENLLWLSETPEYAEEFGEVSPYEIKEGGYRVVARYPEGGVLVERIKEEQKSQSELIANKLLNKETLTPEEQEFYDQNKKQVAIATGGIVMERNKALEESKKSTPPQKEEELSDLQKAIQDYEESEEGNIYTLVDDIEAIAEETGDEQLSSAVKYFRDEQEYDRTISGRHDMEMVENNFVAKVKEAEALQEPTTKIKVESPTEKSKLSVEETEAKEIEQRNLVDQGKQLRTESEEIKSKWMTKKGTFKKGTPQDVLDRAEAIEKEYEQLKKEFNKSLPEVDLEQLPFTKRMVEFGQLEKDAEVFYTEDGELKPGVDPKKVQANYDQRIALETENYKQGYFGQPGSAASESRFDVAISDINSDMERLGVKQVHPNAHIDAVNKEITKDEAPAKQQQAEKIKVFVYGTLKSPETRIEALGEDVPTSKASTLGQVEDVGGSPNLTTGKNTIEGQVMELSPEQLAKLDAWESKYERVPVTLDSGEVVSAYRLKQPPSKKKSKGGKKKKRKFAQQILNAPDISEEVKQGLSEDAKTYIPKGLEITAAEARAIIELKGTEQAMLDYLDLSNGMDMDTRAMLGEQLIKKFNSTEDYDNAIKVADHLAKMFTEAGRMVNAAKAFSLLTPEGMLRYVQKEKRKQKEKFNKETAENRAKSKEEIDKITKDAVEKVIKSPKVKGRIASEVKKGRIKQAIDFLETLKVDTKGKALEATYGLTAALWNTLISTVQKGLQAGLTLSQAINKAVNKVKPESKEFDEAGARSFLEDKLKDYRVTLDPEKAIKEELKAQNDKIENIIKRHYTEVEDTKRTLVDKLIKDAGLTEPEASAIAEELSKEFDRLTSEAKKKALNKYVPKDRSKKAERKDLIDQLVEASNLGALDDAKYRDAIAEKLGPASLTEEQAKKIKDLSEVVQQAKEGFDKNRAIERLMTYVDSIEGASWKDIGMAMWYANILSGISTQVLNISANMAETIGQAYISLLKNPKQAPWILKGLFQGWGRGGLEAADTISNGFQPSKFEQKITASSTLEQVKFKGGGWNPFTYMKYVARMMNAADIFFYQGLNEMRARELAVAEAKKQGKGQPNREIIRKATQTIYKGAKPWEEALEAARSEGKWSGRDLKRRAYEILEQQRPEFLIKDSNDAGARGTFNYDPEGTLGALTSGINQLTEMVNIAGVKPIKFIVPFTRIIANVTNRYLDWSPVGLLRAAKGGIGFKSLGESKYRKYTDEQKVEAYMKSITGIIGFIAMYALTDDDDGPFEITANGTGDLQKNYELQETGWRPYSIKINGTWYEYKNTPLAIPFAILGFIRDAEKYKGEKDPEAKVSIILFGTMKYIMDMSFLQALSSFFDTFSKQSPGSADNFFKKSVKIGEQTLKSFFVPNAFTQVSRSVQEVMDLPIKRANDFGDQIIRDLPLLRDNLGNIYDALGDPVVPNQIERFIPLKPSSSSNDKLWQLIIDNQAWIGRPRRATLKPNGDSMTDDEFDRYALRAGQLTKKYLEQNYSQLSRMKDKSKVQDAIKDIKTQARRDARDRLFGGLIF